jgi:predicted adenylyl cyclase CyaB
MNSNIEIKAKVSDLHKVTYLAKQICGNNAEILRQKDIYYDIPHGRLKLRIIHKNKGELIFYKRENISAPKKSLYTIYSTSDPVSLDAILSKSLRKLGIVKKTRCLYIKEQTRIHIDDVKDLGYFAELEVVLKDNQSDMDGIKIVNDIMDRLHIGKENLIKFSYIDLMLDENKT